MYYLASFSIYSIIVFLFWYLFKKPDKNEKYQFKSVLVNEMTKGLTKSDVESRKKRVKVLPLHQRFIYWIWFSSIIIMLVLPAILLNIARYYLIELFFATKSVFFIDLNSGSLLVFSFGVFLAGVSLNVAYSYLTNRGFIRKADLLYQIGSFQEYPLKMNILISGILVIIGLPLMILGFNSYRYFSEEQIVIKSALSVEENVYSYTDVDYIDHSFLKDGSNKYTIVFKSGKKLILDNRILLNPKFKKIMNDYDIVIKVNE
jgi:hypothetical protein